MPRFDDDDHDDDDRSKVRIVLAGDSGSGKTCLVTRYVAGVFNPHTGATVGSDFHYHTVVARGQEVDAHIWDTAGQERFQFMAPTYFRGAMGVVITYDIASHTSFERARQWATLAADHAKENAFMVLVGCKLDLEYRREVLREEGEEIADDLGMGFVEASAVTGANVDDVFRVCVEGVMANGLLDNAGEHNNNDNGHVVRVDDAGGPDGGKGGSGCC